MACKHSRSWEWACVCESEREEYEWTDTHVWAMTTWNSGDCISMTHSNLSWEDAGFSCAVRAQSSAPKHWHMYNVMLENFHSELWLTKDDGSPPLSISHNKYETSDLIIYLGFINKVKSKTWQLQLGVEEITQIYKKSSKVLI